MLTFIKQKIGALSVEVKQYAVVTVNYWGFTLTDGALRMLVLLYFHQIGYSPLTLALLFIFYELFGVITNLIGGWLGARIGLNHTMNIGLGLQILALAMLALPNDSFLWSLTGAVWVMAVQGLSGIAKDLNKMSAKSAIKQLVPKDQHNQLYRWVVLLTGAKNTLKGIGFFLGGVLLAVLGFKLAVTSMMITLASIWLMSVIWLRQGLGKAKVKPKFTQIFSQHRQINILSAARLCLFAARDIWFVVALPLFLATEFGWRHWQVGSFLAIWVIGYGIVQTLSPWFVGYRSRLSSQRIPSGRHALHWALSLAALPAIIALILDMGFYPQISLLIGLILFGGIFAVNSSLHSYLIVSYASDDKTSVEVGFYYMANAMGRLLGTLLSGWVYQLYGFSACLWISTGLIFLCVIISTQLPNR